MGKAHPSLHACSYIPNTMFLWLIIQLLMTIKPAHKILSLTHRKCWGKPNNYINTSSSLQKNGPFSTESGSNLLTYHLPLQQEIWLVFNSRSNLIGVTYVHLSLIHSLNHSSITYPMHRLRGFFLQKNNSVTKTLCRFKVLSKLFAV